MCGHRFFCRIPASDLRRNRKIHVGRILESDISTIPEFSQCVDIGFFLSDTSIRPTSKPNNQCRSGSRIRHFNHSRIFSMCGHRLFSSDTSIRPTSKPNNPCRSDSRIRHFNHSRIFAIYGHRFFRRIQVSDLR